MDELLPPPQEDGRSTYSDERHTSIKDSSSSVYSRSKQKTSAIHLLYNDFIEMVPIDPVAPSKEPTVGSFFAVEPGNYVLLFGEYKFFFMDCLNC